MPRFTVTDSRNTLRSPISSRVGSPLYFLSCGASPSEANWNILLSAPMRVGPLITTCGPIQVPAPMTTPGPMTLNGPICTSAAISACGETTARAIDHPSSPCSRAASLVSGATMISAEATSAPSTSATQ